MFSVTSVSVFIYTLMWIFFRTVFCPRIFMFLLKAVESHPEVDLADNSNLFLKRILYQPAEPIVPPTPTTSLTSAGLTGCCVLQRATLAEKEVSALKEQLSVANQTPDKMSGTEDIKRSSAEVELNAKDKEVTANRFNCFNSLTLRVILLRPM